MTIIDFHTHFFPANLFRAIWKWFDEFGWDIQNKIFADELIEKLKSIGVTKMVLLNYSHKPGMSRELNRWTREFADRHAGIIPFGAVHPMDEDKDKVIDQCFDDYGFYGIKLHAIVLGMAVDDPVFFPIYEKIEDAGKILLIHAGTGPRVKRRTIDTAKVAGVKRVKVILKRFPRLKLIIPHCGSDEMDAFFDLMGENENLWLDTTMILSGYFSLKPSLERIEELSDRILYGSDSPNIPYPLDTEIENIKRWFSEDVQERLFFKNAEKILGLSNTMES